MWIDSHCHLNHKKLAEAGTLQEVLGNARAAGVEGMLTICCRIADEFPEVLAIAQNESDVWCSIGTHPHEASKDAEKAISQEELVKLATSDPNIIAIGETGLDYYYDFSERVDQAESFRKHLRACVETDLPVIIHARDADDDVAQILREESAGGKLCGVMHCFSSGRGLAEAALDLGFYISFSGIVTFKQAEELRDIAKDVPLERILVETDAPYLAPGPYRGKTNQPAYVVETGACLANIYKSDKEKIASISKNNFFQLFAKAEQGAS